ncbi:MAG TPA: hypothetical protein PK307_02910 [Spirochaetota bacterium]|nr:hypothetical protein [Spirochaetota bacterium]
MRALIIFMTASAVFCAGCVTMPAEVNPEYLVDRTAEEGRTLEKLGAAIIAKRQEIPDLKKKVEDAELKLKIVRGWTAILKQEKSLLENKQKQFQLENDTAKMNANAKLMVDNDYQIRAENERLDYAKAVLELAESEPEVAEAELSVSVAELAFEKAKIARTYLVRKQGATVPDDKKSSSKAPESYDEKYRKYLEQQRERLVSKKTARDEAAKRLKVTEDRLKNKDMTK